MFVVKKTSSSEGGKGIIIIVIKTSIPSGKLIDDNMLPIVIFDFLAIISKVQSHHSKN
tara:strand:+ start:2244 stop:2417 length:174 start_codon:yes stop_codon:yes gene_type:complete